MKSNRFNYQNFGFGSGLSRLIQDAFEGLDDFGAFARKPNYSQLQPPADLYEDDHHYFVTLELPGVQKPDVKVEFIDGQVEISATISRETPDGRKNFPLKRTVSLPDLVGDGELSAKLENVKSFEI